MTDFLLKAVLLVCVHTKSDEILPQTCSGDELDFLAAAVCVTVRLPITCPDDHTPAQHHKLHGSTSHNGSWNADYLRPPLLHNPAGFCRSVRFGVNSALVWQKRRLSILTENKSPTLSSSTAALPPSSAYTLPFECSLHALKCVQDLSIACEWVTSCLDVIIFQQPRVRLCLDIDRPLKLSRHNSSSTHSVCLSITQALFIRHLEAQSSWAARQRWRRGEVTGRSPW